MLGNEVLSSSLWKTSAPNCWCVSTFVPQGNLQGAQKMALRAKYSFSNQIPFFGIGNDGTSLLTPKGNVKQMEDQRYVMAELASGNQLINKTIKQIQKKKSKNTLYSHSFKLPQTPFFTASMKCLLSVMLIRMIPACGCC